MDRTLRDLLGIEIRSATHLPPENVALGFDSIGSAQSLSPAAVEGLLNFAAEVASEAVAFHYPDRALRQRLGVQLQESQFPEKLSVIETITLFRSFYATGLDPDDVLALVGLNEKARAWVRDLSGGQRQRLSLACALVSEPELLFLATLVLYLLR